MHKSQIDNWLARSAEFFDRITNKLFPKRSAAEEAEGNKIMDDFEKDFWETNKNLGLPPLDAKNPYRFL